MLGLGNILTKGGAITKFPNKYSFNFDGSNDYLLLPSDDNFGVNDTWSVSFWFKSDSISTTQALFSASKAPTATNRIGINLHSSVVKFSIYGTFDSTTEYRSKSSTSLSSDTWYHLVATNSNGTLALYINNVEQTGTSSYSLSHSARRVIGSAINFNLPFDGLIDEFAIWNTVIDANTIAKLSSKPVDVTKYSASNLKLWLRAGDKALPEEDASIARQDFYTDFDGTDDVINIAHSSDYKPTTAITVASWYKPTDHSNWGKIICVPYALSGWSDPYFSYALSSTDGTSGKPSFGGAFTNSGIYDNVTATTVMDLNRWYHIVGTYDGTSIKIYVNGVLENTTSRTGDIYYPVDANTQIGGRGEYSAGEHTEGSISSVSVYQTALDAQTISQMAKSRFTPQRDMRFSVVDFDGTNDYIQLGSDISLTGEFTFNFWYNTTHTGTNYLLGHSTENGFVRTQNTGARFGIAFNSVSTFTILLSTTLPLDGTWNNITITRDSSDTIKCYLNGSEVGTSSNRSGDFDINRIANWNSNIEYNGSLSSVSIYNTAKTAEEVYAIYQQGITYDESSLSGLVGYWKMGDDTSKAFPTIADSSSNSNDGTITNGASDDIVQQMVGGWDLGSFESTGQELGGELFGDPSFELSGNNADGEDTAYFTNVPSGIQFTGGQMISTGSGTKIPRPVPNPSLKAGKIYKIVFNTASYTSGSIRFGNSNNSINTGFLVPSTIGDNVFYYSPSGNVDFTRMAVANNNGGTVFTLNSISIKEVLQSEVSDTYPAIIDVTKPILGAEVNTVANATSPTNETNATTGWESGVYASTISSVAEGYTGSYSLKVVTSINIGFAQTSSAWTVDNDSTYKLSITWKTDGTNTNEWQYGWGTTQTNASYGVEFEDGSTDWVTSVKYIKTTSTSLHLYLQEKESTSNALALYVDSISIKKVQGNVGTMTNQATSDLVYSSVLPDQSFLTGVNSAYNFVSLDGSNDYVNTGSPFQSTFRDSFSVSAWIKPTDGIPSAESAIFAVRGSGGRFYIRVLSDGRFSSYINDGTSAKATLPSSVTFSDGQEDWHHVCAVINNSTNLVSLYVDGVEQTLQSGTYSGDISSLTLSNFTSTDNVYIGARNNQGSADRFFDGDIGQISLWNKVLSSTEVSAIYTAGRHSNLLNSYSDNLKAYYAFGALDAVTGLSDTTTTIYDRSGNSNHSTPVSIASADLKSPPNAEPNGYAKQDVNRSTTTP